MDGVTVAALDPPGLCEATERLAEILHACVHEGASVGFVLPFDMDDARAFWSGKIAPVLAAASRIVLVARLNERIAGTAQLDLDTMPNQRHRGEVSKVLVDPKFRRHGLARAMMAEIERRAHADARWLLTLDTAGDAAGALYLSSGYALAGEIPFYARDALEQRYDATRLMYKVLRAS